MLSTDSDDVYFVFFYGFWGSLLLPESNLLKKPEYHHVELNIEGNPTFAEQSNGYPGFMNLVERVRPDQCTLVPDSNQQLTSDHGWNFEEITFDFRQLVERLKSQGIRTSGFVETQRSGPSARRLTLEHTLNAQQVEEL